MSYFEVPLPINDKNLFVQKLVTMYLPFYRHHDCISDIEEKMNICILCASFVGGDSMLDISISTRVWYFHYV
jgi:hypothetical protein